MRTKYTFLANLTGQARRVKVQGVAYIKAPVTLLTPGVHEGNRGRVLYTREVLQQFSKDWDKMPVIVNHPFSMGRPISAKDPSVADRVIGFLTEPDISEKGSLVANAFIEEDKCKRVDGSIIDNILSGKPVEVSTGLTAILKEAKGSDYDYVVAEQYPDHLAILPNATGACSIKDGCGLLVRNAKKGKGMSTEDDARKLEELKVKAGLVDSLITNSSCCWSEEDRPVLGNLSTKTLELLVKEMVSNKKEEAKMAEAVKTPVEPEIAKTPVEPVVNAKPLTEEEWMANAPQGIRDVVANAKRLMDEKKLAIVDRLIVNVAAERQQEYRNRLMKRSMEELEADLALLPPVKREANYTGSIGGEVVNAGSFDKNSGMLPIYPSEK